MEFRILGPLEVVGDDGRPVPLPRQKSRALLALLLLHANEVVSTDRLVDDLWGGNPPRTATASLQNAVSRLRRSIGAEAVVSRPPGYELRIRPEQLDLARFEQLVEEARAGEPEARAAKLREAVALWRGEPLADLANEPFAATEIARLEELRTAAIEDRIDAELALGKDADLVAELETLIRNPLRERLRGQLILALYRAGRQAEALEEYRAARAHLLDELGLEPGEELQQLERAILVQDPALAAPRRADDPSFEAARKVVTTLVAEVTAHGADPERFRLSLERFFDDARIAIERHGGRVHATTGDALTALFGVPTAREDDAFRAVRAAENVVDLLSELELRIGIDTGEAYVRGGEVTGEAATNARRLLDVAAAGEVVLGAATLALVRNAVTAERIEGARARGRALDAFRLVAVNEGEAPVARNLDAPLVGRRHELARLEDELRLAFSERRCRVVTLVGEAGIGKSRLARELVERAAGDAAVLVGRCVSYGEGATYLPLADVVRRAIPDATEDAIAARLPDDEERALVAQRLAALVGVTDAVVPSGDAFWSVRRFFEALARERPLVVFFDDVHWAEPTFLDLVEHLRDWIEDAPLLLLCAARPELLEARPAWGASAVMLGRLADDEARTLVDNLADELADEDRSRVVESAEGNALYVEQLVAAIAEGAEELPPSIEALLAARLDRLGAAERGLLQRASVVGREFDAASLAQLSEADAGRVPLQLASLVRRGLVRSRGDAFRFHHILVREAAYASTPKEVRADLHERVAEFVAADELVGFHLERAYAYGAELGTADETLAHRAGDHLARAGMRAFARADVPAASNLLVRATQLLDERDPRAIELRCELGIVYWLGGDPKGAENTLRDARAAAGAIADRRLELRADLELASSGLYSRADTDASRAFEIARDAIPTFEEFEDDRALGRAWYLVGSIEGGFLCRNAAAIDAVERAIAHYRRADFPPSVCVALLASALYFGPTHVEEATARCRELVASGEGGRNGDAIVRTWLAALAACGGRFIEARALLDDARAAVEQLGQAFTTAQVESVRGHVEGLAGNDEGSERAFRAACEMYEQFGQWANLATHAAWLASALHSRGELDEAERWLQAAEQHAEESDISAQFSWRSARARVLASRGNVGDAEPLARAAMDLVDSTDALNQRADVRLTMAHVLEAAGRGGEAAAARAEALGLFVEKGNVVAAERVRAALRRVPA